ncbi:MAG: hypothetical protein AAF394_01090 [Planctomycetota bacterium]
MQSADSDRVESVNLEPTETGSTQAPREPKDQVVASPEDREVQPSAFRSKELGDLLENELEEERDLRRQEELARQGRVAKHD